jgi:hypothetical protein
MANKEKRLLNAWWLCEEDNGMEGKIIRKREGEKIGRVRGTT